MVVLITGASHTGKTALAQRLLEKYQMPYLSIDHLKMGLIRSKNTTLTPMSDEQKLTDYLWPVVEEIIKTVIENRQNLIVEGCYIPFNWQESFAIEYLRHIRFCCLVLSEGFIRKNFSAMQAHANDVEQRLEDGGFSIETAIQGNAAWQAGCKACGLPYTLIEGEYHLPLELFREGYLK